MLFDGDQPNGPAVRRMEGPVVMDGVFAGYQPLEELSPYQTYVIRLGIQN